MHTFARRLHGRSDISLLLRWRWLVLLIAVPLSMLIELLEGQTHDLHFLDEVMIDGLILPLTTWAVLTFAAGRLARQLERVQSFELRQQLVRRLSEIGDYGELTQFIVRYSATLLPAEQVSLFVCERHDRRFKLVAAWGGEHARPANAPAPAPEYRFALLVNNVQVGVLAVRCRPDARPAGERVALLTALAPEMARALAHTIADGEQQERLYRAARAYERRRLTQELHDSLAQQVFYLNLGLDQLSNDTALAASTTVRRKLLTMCDVASEVYEQIRNNLSLLRSWEQVNLTEAVGELARATAHNADLSVAFDARGEPAWLSPRTCEHVYGIVREGLHNVVKHARARHAQLDLVWSAEQLSITLADDGVGFDAATPPGDGHYGLLLMRQTVETLEGCLSFDSRPGAGTRLQLTVPLRRGGAPLLARPEQLQGLQLALDAAP